MKKKLKATMLCAVCLCLFLSGTYALANQAEDKPASEFNEELQYLVEEAIVYTDIATKTILDANMVPGMVTILNGEDLERMGALNVRDALNLVPGMFRSSGNVIVRGIGEIFASGKLKLLLNGIPMNNTLSGEIGPYAIPIELVKRIEVIRGPGSALYGKGAYAGVINVVTYNDGKRIYIGTGKSDYFIAGGTYTYKNEKTDLKVNVNLNYNRVNPVGIMVNRDSLYDTPYEDVSAAPGLLNNKYNNITGLLTVNYKDVYLTGQSYNNKYGAGFGMTGALVPYENRYVDYSDTQIIEAGWNPDISTDLSAKLKVGWRLHTWDMDDLYLYPPGFAIYEDGLIAGPHYRERSLYSGGELYWSGWNKHKLLIGAEFENIKGMDQWQDLNYDPYTEEPLDDITRFSGEDGWLDEQLKRTIYSAYIQDQFDIFERMTLTAGIRYDNYSDSSDKLSPRIAAVYRLTDNHIIKAQYAEAFRPPTFLEMYFKNNPVGSGNHNIDAEIVKTWEMGYIYRAKPIEAKLTMFYSKLEDLIMENKDGQYFNSGGATTRGSELEFQWNVSPVLILAANTSYAYTVDQDTGKEIPGAAMWLGNLGVMTKLQKDLYVSVWDNYVGERARADGDPRERLSAENSTNVTLVADNLFTNGVTLKAGISNLFDTDIKSPSSYSSFAEDKTASKRTWWVTLSYTFK